MKPILANSILFSACHIVNSIFSPLVIFPGAFVLCWVYYKVRNLRVTMLMHFSYNLVVIIYSNILNEYYIYDLIRESGSTNFWVMILILLFLGIFACTAFMYHGYKLCS